MGQVIKGLRWMPWVQGPKKGAARLRKASVSCLASLAGDSRMGKPVMGHTMTFQFLEREPCELKHLSNTRKRNQTEIPLVVANERGIA